MSSAPSLLKHRLSRHKIRLKWMFVVGLYFLNRSFFCFPTALRWCIKRLVRSYMQTHTCSSTLQMHILPHHKNQRIMFQNLTFLLNVENVKSARASAKMMKTKKKLFVLLKAEVLVYFDCGAVHHSCPGIYSTHAYFLFQINHISSFPADMFIDPCNKSHPKTW